MGNWDWATIFTKAWLILNHIFHFNRAQKLSAYSKGTNTSGFYVTSYSDSLLSALLKLTPYFPHLPIHTIIFTVHFQVLLYNTDSSNDQNCSCSGDAEMSILPFIYFTKYLLMPISLSFLNNKVFGLHRFITEIRLHVRYRIFVSLSIQDTWLCEKFDKGSPCALMCYDFMSSAQIVSTRPCAILPL